MSVPCSDTYVPFCPILSRWVGLQSEMHVFLVVTRNSFLQLDSGFQVILTAQMIHNLPCQICNLGSVVRASCFQVASERFTGKLPVLFQTVRVCFQVCSSSGRNLKGAAPTLSKSSSSEPKPSLSQSHQCRASANPGTIITPL